MEKGIIITCMILLSFSLSGQISKERRNVTFPDGIMDKDKNLALPVLDSPLSKEQMDIPLMANYLQLGSIPKQRLDSLLVQESYDSPGDWGSVKKMKFIYSPDSNLIHIITHENRAGQWLNTKQDLTFDQNGFHKQVINSSKTLQAINGLTI